MPDDTRTKYDNISFNISTPAGTANIIIVEDSPGIIYKIFFTIGKAGNEVNACCFAIAELAVDTMKRGATVSDVIALLSDITASRPVFDKDGTICRSIPEALYLVLVRYRNLNKQVNKFQLRESVNG